MLAKGGAVALSNGLSGYVRRLTHASQGRRWWHVDWDDGTDSVVVEDLLVDVERQEWADARRGVPEHLRCPSLWAGLAGSGAGAGRRCGMREGHRTRRHRNCEISWTDEMARK